MSAMPPPLGHLKHLKTASDRFQNRPLFCKNFWVSADGPLPFRYHTFGGGIQMTSVNWRELVVLFGGAVVACRWRRCAASRSDAAIGLLRRRAIRRGRQDWWYSRMRRQELGCRKYPDRLPLAAANDRMQAFALAHPIQYCCRRVPTFPECATARDRGSRLHPLHHPCQLRCRPCPPSFGRASRSDGRSARLGRCRAIRRVRQD